MGVWHGLALHFVLYGLYHAALLCGYDWFARWNKQAKRWGDGPWWRAGNIVLTFHAFAFSILLFNGRLTPHAPPAREEVVEKADCHEVVGYVWDRAQPAAAQAVDIYIDYGWVARIPADQLREDLRDRGLGDGRLGFRFEVPAYVRDGHSHAIEVRLVGPNRELQGSPEVIACERGQ
jgi:membrane protein involved in D-alanine export